MINGYDKTEKFKILKQLGFPKYFRADSWEGYNREFFDWFAPRYDLLDAVLSLGMQVRFKTQAIRNAAIGPRDKVLDLCTGSGDIAILIARMFPQARVTGVDVSTKMLEVARDRAKGLDNVEFVTADALRLPYPDRTFDVTFISLGLRNLVDLEKGILEMKRVTKPGGRVVNLDLGKPKGWFLNFIYKVYFLNFVPFLGATVFHRNECNTFRYLVESGKYFPRQEELVSIFRELGLRDVRNYDFMLGAVAQQVGIVP